jgi:hypothetical protein
MAVEECRQRRLDDPGVESAVATHVVGIDRFDLVVEEDARGRAEVVLGTAKGRNAS